MGSHELNHGHDHHPIPVTYGGEHVTLTVSDPETLTQVFSDTRFTKSTFYHNELAGDIIPFVKSIDIAVDNYDFAPGGDRKVPPKRVLATTIEWIPSNVLESEEVYVAEINERLQGGVGNLTAMVRQSDAAGSPYILQAPIADQAIWIGAQFEKNVLTVYTEPSYSDTPEGRILDGKILDAFFTATLHVIDGIKEHDGKHAFQKHAELPIGLPKPGNMIMKLDTPAEARTHPPAESELLTFESLGGLTYAKRRLREIANVFKYPDLAAELDISASHFLLHGPPGMGKTTLVEILANEIGAELRKIKMTDIGNSYIWQTAINFAQHVQQAIADSKDKRIVLFFDEFDSIADNKASQHREYETTINAIKDEIDAIDHPVTGSPNLILAAATNKDVSDINDAIVSRLEVIGAPVPNDEERDDIWRTLMARREGKRKLATHEDFGVTSTIFSIDLQLADLVRETEGLTGRDIMKILKAAQMTKFSMTVDMRESGRQSELDQNPQLKQISQSDLMRAIDQFKKSRG